MGISRPIFQSYQNVRVLTYDRSYKWNLNVHERICVKYMSTAVNRLTPGPRVHKNPGSKTDYGNITCNNTSNGREATLYPSPPPAKKKQLWFYIEMINIWKSYTNSQMKN